MFKSKRCEAIANMYVKNNRSPRSAKVISVKEAPRLLDLLEDEIIQMEIEAIKSRDFKNQVAVPSKATQVTWEEFDVDAEAVVKKIKDDNVQIDAVVAIARGGLALGQRLAHRLHIRSFGSVTAWKCPTPIPEHEDGPTERPRFEAVGLPSGEPRVIVVVDDTVGHGQTMVATKRLILDQYKNHTPEVVFAALYQLKKSSWTSNQLTPLYYARARDEEWLDLPWEDPEARSGYQDPSP